MTTLEELQKQIEEAQKQVDASRSINYRGSSINIAGGPSMTDSKDGGTSYQGFYDAGGRFRKFRQHPDVLAADKAYRSATSNLTNLQKQYADMQKQEAPPPMKYEPVAEPARPPAEKSPPVSRGDGSFEYSYTNAPMYEQFKQSDFYKNMPKVGATVVGSSTIDGKSYSFPMAMEAEAYNKYMRSLGNYNVGGGESNTGLLENPSSKYMGGFRQPGDMGRYVAFNDPGQPGEGFANAQEYEAALNQGKKNMVATPTEEESIEKMKKQSVATEMPAGTSFTPDDQTIQSNELLSASGKTISAPKVDMPNTLTAQDIATPAEFNPAAYEAQVTAAAGQAAAAQKELSANAIMQAAQGSVSPEALATAATQQLDPRATTRYQLEELFKGIEAGGPPPVWASPAVRKVSAIMQQRGLGSSSMAAAATMQAMMESGITIAAQDAQKYATIQLQNLSNEQQATLQNAATMAAMDMANLNNRQQAAVSNAKAFLSLDLQNLTNEQQSNTISYQAKAQALLTDSAAQNAAKQFNAKSENEINTFFSELGLSVESANVARKTAIDQYNVGQTQAARQFNATMQANQESFNANMRKEIDQSNAVWRRTVNTSNTANQNEANRQNALNLLSISQNALNNLWQVYRDKAAWSVKISESAADRAHNAALQAASIAASQDLYSDKYKNFLTMNTIDNIFKVF